MKEDKVRSIVKAIVYRILSVVTIFVTIQVITGDSGQSVKLALYTNIVTSAIYYIHERAWNRVSWRRQ